MPESGRQEPTRWQIAGWSLRTKVAVVLVVPTLVALALGGARVQAQLDTANRLSAVRDQLTVLTESVALTDLLAQEQLAAVSPRDPGFDDRRAEVDAQVAVVREAAGFAALPTTVDRQLDDTLERLGPLRQRAEGAGEDPIAVAGGYREVMTALSDLVSGVVSLARNEDLDDRAAAVRSLLLLRATLATEEALIVSGADGAAAAAQNAAAEEAVLGQQLAPDLLAGDRAEFAAATDSARVRRDTLLAAVGDRNTGALTGLLPGLRASAAAVNAFEQRLFDDLLETVSARTNDARSDALRDSAIVLGALLAALAVALTVARSLLSPLHRLRSAALTAAHDQLPATVERVRAGERVDWRGVEPVPVHTDEEIGQVARAFDDMHQQAVRLAGEQAELRLQVSEMFMTLSRRSQSLVELQLGVIEELEADERDPQRLAGLFRLDHLATRLRRNGENLQVLAGGTPPRRGNRPVGVVELLRAATSEITDYRRVTLGHAPSGSVRGSAAADLVHILAELLENATRFSPPDRKVVLTADRGTDGGLLFEVVDGGLGMAEDDLAAANARLATTDSVGPETTRRMGLFVVSQLAARHGVTVRLRPTYDSANQAGVTASIHVPAGLVVRDTAAALPSLAPATAAAGTAAPGPVLSARWTPTAPPAPVAAPATNGHQVGWFTPFVEVDEPEQTAASAPGWPSPAEPPPTRRPVAEPVASGGPVLAGPPPTDAPAGTTAAGLPMRRPGGRAPDRPAETPERQRVDFRDPESIRNNLSRHYSGMQAARRARAAAEAEPEASDAAAPRRRT